MKKQAKLIKTTPLAKSVGFEEGKVYTIDTYKEKEKEGGETVEKTRTSKTGMIMLRHTNGGGLFFPESSLEIIS